MKRTATCDHVRDILDEHQDSLVQHLHSRPLGLQMRLHYDAEWHSEQLGHAWAKGLTAGSAPTPSCGPVHGNALCLASFDIVRRFDEHGA